MTYVKYSVIIPAYNAQDTIVRCLDLLLCQKREDVELIIINDGSVDHTDEIVTSYAQNNDSIVYVKQENAGVSAARNRGLELARGTYITFVDSDDYVSDCYFDYLDQMDDIEDLCCFMKSIANDDASSEERYFVELSECVTWIEKVEYLLKARLLTALNSKRFKADIIQQEQLRFIDTLNISEDFNFSLTYILHTQTIGCYPHCLYYIDVNNNDSLSRKARPRLTSDLEAGFQYAAQSIVTSKRSEEEKNRLLTLLDYQYVKSVCTCIAETFKFKAPNYLKNYQDYKAICQTYQKPLIKNHHYTGMTHRLMRYFLKHHFYFPFYMVSAVVKGKQYSLYRNQ